MAYFGPRPASGFNPRWGRDENIQPPHSGGYAAPMPGYANPAMYGAVPPAMPAYGYQPPFHHAPGYYCPGVGAGQPPNPQAYGYMSGFGGGTRYPQPHPVVDPDLPASNMMNSTGGVGCEPGYNYFFAPEHTKIHVLKCGATPPWELPRNFSVPFHACHVPVSTTLGELLKGMGATNPIAKKNKVFEVVQGGNGKWYKGVGFNADDGASMGQTLKDLGWDSSRSGLPGKKPVVYLYITKD